MEEVNIYGTSYAGEVHELISISVPEQATEPMVAVEVHAEVDRQADMLYFDRSGELKFLSAYSGELVDVYMLMQEHKQKVAKYIEVILDYLTQSKNIKELSNENPVL